MSNFLFPEPQPSWEDHNAIKIFPLSSNILNIALTGAKAELQKFFGSPTALEKLDRVFDITDQNAAHILIENSAVGIFEQIPHMQIVNDAGMNGAQGAFSEATNTIYLSDSLVRGDSLKVQEVLLEELGHKFDTLLNPGGDTPGDEGELFKDVVLDLPLSQAELLRIQTENDFGTVVIDNQVIPVEQSYNSLITSSPKLTKNRGGWSDNDNYPRLSGDFNGDGQDDVVGFGADNLFVSLSNGNGTFGTANSTSPSASNGFTKNRGGWTDNNNYPRLIGDVNGDNKDDIVGFGSNKVFVSLSKGDGTFNPLIGSIPSPSNGFTKNVGGWSDYNNYPRFLGDVNGDKKADIIGFGQTNVFVSLGKGDGTFNAPIASTPSASNGFTKNLGGWSDQNNYPRQIGDVNGDGKADIVGFGQANVFVSLGKGDGTFNAPVASTPSASNGFTKNVGGWSDNNNFPRVLADVNGDKNADIVGFGTNSVFVSLSRGNGKFDAPAAYNVNLTKNLGGWTDNNNYPRVVGDVNKDGKDDLISFGASDVFVSLSGSSVSSPPPPPPGKYQLPYPDGTTYKVNAGNNNGGNHSNQWNSYAWDFDMPEGSTVVATRGGKVISLYEGSNTKLSSETGWEKYTNYVLIDHGDGTSALYAHLKYNSVLPNVGDSVSQNQPIAQSGNTGYSTGAHLHYSVQRTPSYVPPGGFKNTGGYWQASLPSSFSDPGVLSKNSNGVPTYPNNYTS
ncbi:MULTISPECIES: FG-GAP-like repeat-containing protein [unclassified Microcoleus]|uniref:FG-GAP-like repeat-containing protein n=1 Tax=unclassified Microcoleus TaxID=2642155 RepID=UPI002FD43B20